MRGVDPVVDANEAGTEDLFSLGFFFRSARA
jgi:hypothetical protein